MYGCLAEHPRCTAILGSTVSQLEAMSLQRFFLTCCANSRKRKNFRRHFFYILITAVARTRTSTCLHFATCSCSMGYSRMSRSFSFRRATHTISLTRYLPSPFLKLSFGFANPREIYICPCQRSRYFVSRNNTSLIPTTLVSRCSV